MSKVAKKLKTQPTIIPIESEDKKGLDPVPPQDHPLSMPRGSRVCLLAPPGHGKTSTRLRSCVKKFLVNEKRVSIDSVTEIGLAVEPIVQGPRDTSGKTSGTLARFTIPKGSQPGDILGFESKNPTKVSVQAFIGQDINRLTFRLVDQHNESITNLAGEHFSAVVVLAYD